MFSVVLGAVVLLIGVRVWGAIAPYLFARALLKNKKFVKSVQDLDASYKAIDNNMDNFCKRYPRACLDALERRRRFRLLTAEEYEQERSRIIGLLDSTKTEG